MIRVLFIFTLFLPVAVTAAEYELLYEESEPGVEPFTSRLLVSDRWVRIDDLSDDSGYILYDDKLKKIFSINHLNQSTLVIKAGEYEMPAIGNSLVITDKPLSDAPRVSGKTVHDYRVRLKSDVIEEVCTHIQYAAGLLPEVGRLMHAYQATMVANQVRTLEQMPPQYQTPCMLSDQVYFDGSIYTKGLPITESRSNGRQRILKAYNNKELDSDLFTVPDYRQFSLE